MLQNAHILVPTDFSAHSTHALSYAREQASAFQATLHLVHVIQEIEYTEEWGNVYTKLKEIGTLVEERSQEKLDATAGELRSAGITVETALVHGRPDIVLAEYAVKHAIALIVIATHGKRGLEHFVLGSTTERLIRSALCPVLVVRPGHDE
jgi:nucleotide-binding universal stress UspA family protein